MNCFIACGCIVLCAFPAMVNAQTLLIDAPTLINSPVEEIHAGTVNPDPFVFRIEQGGYSPTVRLFNRSSLEMSGGQVGGLYVIDNAQAKLSGGITNGLVVKGEGYAELSRTVSANYVTVREAGTVDFRNGRVATSVFARGNGIFNWYDGEVNAAVFLNENSTGNYFGGRFGQTLSFQLYDNATINVHAPVQAISIIENGNPLVRFYGSHLIFTPYPPDSIGFPGYGYVTGFTLDGQPYNTLVASYFLPYRLELVSVPVPAGVAWLIGASISVAGLMLRRRRR